MDDLGGKPHYFRKHPYIAKIIGVCQSGDCRFFFGRCFFRIRFLAPTPPLSVIVCMFVLMYIQLTYHCLFLWRAPCKPSLSTVDGPGIPPLILTCGDIQVGAHLFEAMKPTLTSWSMRNPLWMSLGLSPWVNSCVLLLMVQKSETTTVSM